MSASGKLDNKAGASVTSTADMKLSASILNNDGNIKSGTTLTVTNTGSVNNTGGINAGTTLYVTTTGNLTNTGDIAAGDASLNVGGTLTNGTSPNPTKATIHASGTLNITAGALNNYGGVDTLMPRGEISGMYLNITTSGDVLNQGNLFAAQDLIITSHGNVENNFGWIKAGNYISISAAGKLDNVVGLIQGKSGSFSASSMENAVLVRPDDELLLTKKHRNAMLVITTQNVAQAVIGWDKAVLARFGTTDTKVLDTIRLQLGDPFLMQQQQQGKRASNFPQPAGRDKSKHTDVAKGASPTAF